MNNSWNSLEIVFLLIVILTSSVLSQNVSGDEWLDRPIDDKTFLTYLDFFSYDVTLSFEETVLGLDETEGLIREHITFQSTSDINVTSYLYYPVKHDLKNHPALVLLHGGTGSGKDASYNVVHAQQLARGGWTVFAIDLLHFGERKSGLLTKFTENEKHENLYNKPSEYLAWIIQSVKDIGRAFDFLVAEKGIDKDHIGLFGLSRGAQVSIIAAGVIQKFNAVILYHGGHFDALEKGHSGAACPANYIGRISPSPLLMVNGIYDNDYNKDFSVQPLFLLAKEPKKIIWTEGGHMFSSEEDRADIMKWLNQNLK